MEEQKIVNAMESFKSEAIKNTVNAFNEGFMLGQQYAEQVFKNESEK